MCRKKILKVFAQGSDPIVYEVGKEATGYPDMGVIQDIDETTEGGVISDNNGHFKTITESFLVYAVHFRNAILYLRGAYTEMLHILDMEEGE